uniref:S phase cyclin A-associated protein in the endoplasmic reticulum n=1 Tax=Phallusia mammillata TaxID=59560 RepID=A0A6F9DSL5_9ASCI|nr:S phase cyclin A-associated protein in the endoplasmic reticulum [Phallusia mammillata]
MNRARERDESTSSSGNVSVASVGGGRKRNKNQANKPPNPVTVEKVRMIMEQEGRSARNLVSWSIPLDTYLSKAKPSKTSRHRNQSKRAQSCESALRKINAEPKEKYVERSYSGDRKKQKNLPNESLMGQASGGPRKNVSIRARYWAYLFENLRRAVDEIYTTCEGDASVMECKEVLLVLDNYRHDFQALINWIKLQERLDNAGIHDRPTSLAWEVRKSSPGRPRQKVTAKVPEASAGRMSSLTSDTKINRLLNFSKAADVASLNASSAVCLPSTVEPIKGTTHVIGNLTMQHATVTWADRVKGVAPVQIEVKREVVATENLDVSETYPKQNPADDDGGEWETVSSRTRQSKHSKNIKHEAQVLKNIANTAMQHHTKPIRLTPEKPAPKPDTGFLNLVVDHLIESGSPKLTREQLKTEVDKCLEVTPVQFMNDCDAKESDKFQHDATEKLTFAGDFLQGQGDGLCDLDDAEAQFFKTVQDENAKVPEQDKTLDELPTLENSSKPIIKPDLVTMEQLKQHDESIAAAEEQERDLRRQIQEVEEGKPGGRDTPEIETDSESARSSMGAKDIGQLDKTTNGPLEWSEFLARYDYTEMGHNSWCELVEEEELREPGRAVQMHEKLSSPSRKRTPAESKRKLEEKHRKAEARRLQMQEEKTHRIHELTEKVQEVVSWKNDLIQRQKLLLQSYHDEKLARAEEMRAMQLLNIKKKAQAEDTKVNEIAFINELQEQNKRHEVLMRIGEHEARMQEIEMERSKQMEMKNAKEEIFKERRRALEKERQERIEELKVKRKEQDARIEQQKIEKEKEREKIAKERARDRELRLSARNAAQQEAVTELQKKIQLKHDESERRHQEQLEHRKEKAVELSLGRFSTNPAPGVAMTPCPGAASIPVPCRLSTGTSEGDGVNVSLIGEETVAVQYDRVSQISIEGKGDAIEPSSASRGSTNTSPRSHIDECKVFELF